MAARPMQPPADADHVGYVLKGYPRLSEVFITSEVHRVEQLGLPLRLFVLTQAESGDRHPVVERVRAVPVRMPATTSLTGTTTRAWLRRNGSAFAPALRRVVRAHPLGVARSAGMALVQAVRARKRFWAAPRKLYLKEWLLAVSLADEVLTAGDVRHLHAHFAHGTTTVTWLAATMTGLPFSFTAHAKDIYSAELNPAGLLRRKLDAARFAVTCTGANVEHLRGLGSPTPVHLVYHGLSADLAVVARATAAGAGPRHAVGTAERAAAQPVRLLAVARLVRKKGLDVLVDAVAVLHARGRDVEAVLVGEDGDAAADLRARIAAAELGDRVRLLGALRQDQLGDLYRAADVFPLPCRVMDDGDRDGIPNVLMEAMVFGLPVVTTPVSGIPELVEDGETGLLVPPEDPAALADAVERLVDDAGLRLRVTAAARRTVTSRFDADLMAARLVGLLGGEVSRERADAPVAVG